MNVYGQAMSSSKREAKWEGCRDGAQAVASERLNVDFPYWEFMGVCSKSPNPVSD
jgi:hypothetical protein